AIILVVSTPLLAIQFLSVPPSSDSNNFIKTAPKTEGVRFIENVLPIDAAKYNITLKKPIPSLDNNVTYMERYLLQNQKNTLEIDFTYMNNILQFCTTYVMNGSILLKDNHLRNVDAALNFLEKYQNYSKLDSSQLINLLQEANSSENRTVTSGNLTLAISNVEFPYGTQTTSFMWTYVFDGCEYTRLSLSFDNGTFGGFSDARPLYRIGNTAVNVSMKQAVDIAKERIKSYSYEMPGGVWIKDFNVSYTSAELRSNTREPYVLHPYWQVRLFLDKQYPGSVTNLLVDVWADNGEVFFCYHDGMGHKDY
ncbi:MAG TPA: hypothetical protein VF350_07345, partial [Candidatus Bathyarchaeia archaeon]